MKKTPQILLHCLIVVLVARVVTGLILSEGGSLLASGGWKAFRYYTVLSNVYCAASCLAALFRSFGKNERGCSPRLYVFRLTGSAVVLVTFLVVVLFLGPVYGYRLLYSGVNLWLHLVVPLLAALNMLLVRPDRAVPFSATLWGIVPTLLYGAVYGVVNAVTWTGRSDPAVDVYGFLKWGWGIGVVFLLSICLISWLSAIVLWAPGRNGPERAG